MTGALTKGASFTRTRAGRLVAAGGTAAVFLLVLIALAGAGRARAAAVTAGCTADGGFNESSASDSQLSACGIEKFPLLKTVKMSDGGTMYEYQGVNGQMIYVPVAPAGFDAATASPAEQVRYGVPPEPPAPSSQFSMWTAAAQNWHPNPGGPPQYMYANTSASFVSGGWAGYGNTAQSWREADAEYTQPAIGGSRCTNDTIAFWSGIGGYTDGYDFGQTGTADGLNGWPNGAAWAESDPSGGNPPYQYPGNPTVAAGLGVAAFTQWNGSNTYMFTIYLNGQPYTFGLGGTWLAGAATAEAVAEHVSGTNITNFGSMTMNGYSGTSFSPLSAHPTWELTTGGISVGGLSGASYNLTQTNCAG